MREVIFQTEGSPISVNLSTDSYEDTEKGMVIRLTYWEVWELIHNLSDMKKEVKT